MKKTYCPCRNYFSIGLLAMQINVSHIIITFITQQEDIPSSQNFEKLNLGQTKNKFGRESFKESLKRETLKLNWAHLASHQIRRRCLESKY